MKNPARPFRACEHLVTLPDDYDYYYVVFSGQGTEHDWICESCHDSGNGTSPMTHLTDELWETLLNSCSEAGIVGMPEIRVVESPLVFQHRRIDYQFSKIGGIVDLQPGTTRGGTWFALSPTGEITELQFSESVVQTKLRYTISKEDFVIDDETVLLISPDDAYAAVFGASTQFGVVIDFRSQKVALRLDRKAYRPENSYFPVEFFKREEKIFIVAATDWNRLDIFSLPDGSNVTERHRATEDDHPLNYFHARLSISPNQKWIADNGWVWHPVGMVATWNLDAWLNNPWESEDGETHNFVVQRDYHWDGPLCWIDDTTLAIYGFGMDEDRMLPAARIIDVQSARQIRWFPGPEARLPPAWPPKKQPQSFVFDEYLFAISDKSGTSVWNVDTGERLALDKDLQPSSYHRVSKEFLSWDPAGVTLSRLKEPTN